MGSLDDIALYETDTPPEEFVRNMWEERLSIEEIGKELSLSETTVRKYLKTLNLPACFEQRHYFYNMVVLLKNKGYTIQDLSEEFGKTKQNLYMLFKKQNWRKATIAL